jgi:hypothetical protein
MAGTIATIIQEKSHKMKTSGSETVTARVHCLGILSIFCFAAAGCSAPVATVEGQVRLGGQPLPGGSIILFCEDGQIVRGMIDQQGHYQVVNVPYGTARVAIQVHRPQPEGLYLSQQLPPVIEGPVAPGRLPPNPSRFVSLPPRYSIPEESGLSVQVGRKMVHCDWDLSF